MSTVVVHRLDGLIDPSGASLGFLVPVFSDGRSNAPLVQRISPKGRVRGFEPYEAPDAPRLPSPPIPLQKGDPAVHAFAFGRGDVVIATDLEDMERLALRIDDAALAARPMLAMELASFLGRTDLMVESALRVHLRLRKSSSTAADTWRDLSVLTTEIRRRLQDGSDRVTRGMSAELVATARGQSIEIAGLPVSVEPASLAEVRSATEATLSELKVLYPPPENGWRIAFRQHGRQARHEAAAAVLVVSDRVSGPERRRYWPAVLDLDVIWDDMTRFVRAVEETSIPLFVAYDAETPDRMQSAAGDWTVRDMHGLAIGSFKAAVPTKSIRRHWRTTYVTAPGIRNSGPGPDRGLTVALELAMAAELDRVAADISWPIETATLLRARGSGVDPESDGWAALYDRAWSSGLAPWRCLCIIPGSGGNAPTMRDRGWTAEALFDAPPIIDGDAVRRVMGLSHATAAMLVDVSPRDDADLLRHKHAIMRVLERTGWSIHDRDHGDAATPIEIVGARGSITLRFGTPARPAPKAAPFPPERLAIDLRRPDAIVVTCGATPTAAMAQIATTSELAVDVRDLVDFEARVCTPLSLAGHQLKRMVMGLHSASRTRLLALVVRQAFEFGEVTMNDPSGLASMLDDAELGSRLHLAVRTTTSKDGVTYAEMRSFDRDGPSGKSTTTETFRIVVTPDVVILEDSLRR